MVNLSNIYLNVPLFVPGIAAVFGMSCSYQIDGTLIMLVGRQRPPSFKQSLECEGSFDVDGAMISFARFPDLLTVVITQTVVTRNA